ncbi:hypothetical protein I551_6657 [Mycobacterium ulcerans str. Harvey]|uniref:Uncharacterized protein n=1 Tax=Mycobacterium ulcerans str. Harvey TaxID=1299332 RepID=A0ABP3A5W6_MYCUL|nr:hypothetical protein I551_6657 [Mycobacterium ulcerans str. Harvey]
MDQVRAMVPESQWCPGHPKDTSKRFWPPRRPDDGISRYLR